MKSLGSAMREVIAIWARTAETDTWACVLASGRACITELDLRGRRTTSVMLDPDISHVARVPMAWKADLIEGRRMVRASDGQEFVIGPVRDNADSRLLRHVRCYLKAEKAITAS